MSRTPIQVGNPEAGSVASPKGAILAPTKVGATLGRYELLATIGHGAMATVFRARDTQLGRDVALKVMSMAHATRGGAAERFRREAHAVAALKHPAILEIYDFVAATSDDPSYIVAELIQGPTLRKFLDEQRGRVLPEIAALLALPLAEALTAAHERGVIHRDVKPDNVMIESRGDTCRVVLTDFGIAHITGMETMTATGALVGSPAYMSPEQSRGQEAGPGADIWAMGALLYEMVTGVLPFAGKDPYTVLSAIIRGAFRRPSQVAATVGPDFETIVLRCLKTNPSERYASAALLASDLHEFLAHAGLVPDGKSLQSYRSDPEKFEAALRPRIADAAVARARLLARHGQLARALAEIGHATAYVPNHGGADKLLRRLSASRTAIKIAVVLAGLCAALAVVWLAKPLLTRRSFPPPSSVAALTLPTPARTPTSPEGLIAPKSPAPGPRATPASRPATMTTPLAAKSPPRPTRHVRAANRTTLQASAPVQTASDQETSSQMLPPEPPPQADPSPRPGTIALFAKGGFCYPSLDDQPAHDLMPVYRNSSPGKHKIFCARTLQSRREFAGEVELPPGARIERTVTEHEGHLTLAKPK